MNVIGEMLSKGHTKVIIERCGGCIRAWRGVCKDAEGAYSDAQLYMGTPGVTRRGA